ncbi:hypothetical protein IE81DRAFT_319836 [Ceraceosorus guamensis]|uniref:Dolichyl-diphosphooligosaccharide-protein glycosyltransferase subunit OST5 n=1 Tax=Ceraceosorus guamensis TaxID=1522189 RepID=A0A316W7Y5_9BASI|nr:hypothetical protein IE81DRAFT_319836 [Ceraceosorus guamensis]PWN45979.1 hypothetical protein IE81DRAFT_319836 [Ceraceosorus guamensis]
MVQQVAFSVAESAHISAQAFTPDIPVSLLPYLATLLLSLAFLLGFYFTTVAQSSEGHDILCGACKHFDEGNFGQAA